MDINYLEKIENYDVPVSIAGVNELIYGIAHLSWVVKNADFSATVSAKFPQGTDLEYIKKEVRELLINEFNYYTNKAKTNGEGNVAK